jgi:hypothetical protein
MTGAVTLLVMAAAVFFMGRYGWRNAAAWAAQAWEDPIEQERRRATLRRGAVACWFFSAVLASGAVASAVVELV